MKVMLSHTPSSVWTWLDVSSPTTSRRSSPREATLSPPPLSVKLSVTSRKSAVLVEDAEGLLKLLLGVSVLHLAGHQRAELREVNGAVAISIDLVDHVLELSLGRVLAEGAHDSTKLLGGDGAIAVLVEGENASLNSA